MAESQPYEVHGEMAVTLRQLFSVVGEDPDEIKALALKLSRRAKISDDMLMSLYIMGLKDRLGDRVSEARLARLAGRFEDFRDDPNYKKLAHVGSFRRCVNPRILLRWTSQLVSGDDPKFPNIGKKTINAIVDLMFEDGVLQTKPSKD